MHELLAVAAARVEAGETVAVATVVESTAAAVLTGSSALLDEHGEPLGDLVLGPLRDALLADLHSVASEGTPILRERVVATREGGRTIEMFVERLSSATFHQAGLVVKELEAGRPLALLVVIDHPDMTQRGRRAVVLADGELHGSVCPVRSERTVVKATLRLMAAGRSSTMRLNVDSERGLGTMRLLVATVAPSAVLPGPRLDFGAARFMGPF